MLLARKGYTVHLWARSQTTVEAVKAAGQNDKYLPGVLLPPALEITNSLETALAGVHIVVMVTPSQGVRDTIKKAVPYLHNGVYIVSATKGFELDSLLRNSEVITEVLPFQTERIAVISGPNHAEEVGRDMPTTTVVAAKKRIIAEYLQDIFMTPTFRVYTNPDVVGVEIGGALKNIIALGTGIADGLNFGDNSKAALMTRGLAEITRLGMAMGARPLTFAGLSGLGDLVVTCTSMHSRNRRAGIELGRGKKMAEIVANTGMVVEGIRTTKAAYALARKYGIEMPITEQIYKILYEEKNPHEAVVDLMLRGKTHEAEEIVTGDLEW
jgi:glycerol-3-phosphate dehydrogenase (NAD(P)+)